MRQNELPPVPGSVRKRKRIGRGNASGHGTYASRGLKGQKSRSGPDLRIGFEGGQIPLVRALSRRRGFHNRFRVEYEPVNVASLARFEGGATVDVAALRAVGLVKSGRLPVKILGDGEIAVALTVEAHRFSAAAKAKIEAAGGKAVALNEPAEETPAEEARPRRATRKRATAEETPDEPEETADEPKEGDES